ncbi:MAG: hypothetical protein NVSMB43_02270 [Pseudarthrobacter sp.]
MIGSRPHAGGHDGHTRPARKPGGTPADGQFTAPAHSDSVPALTVPSNPFRDADGTTGESAGHEYQATYTNHVGGMEARITTDIREDGARSTVVDLCGAPAGVPRLHVTVTR